MTSTPDPDPNDEFQARVDALIAADLRVARPEYHSSTCGLGPNHKGSCNNARNDASTSAFDEAPEIRIPDLKTSIGDGREGGTTSVTYGPNAISLTPPLDAVGRPIPGDWEGSGGETDVIIINDPVKEIPPLPYRVTSIDAQESGWIIDDLRRAQRILNDPTKVRPGCGCEVPPGAMSGDGAAFPDPPAERQHIRMIQPPDLSDIPGWPPDEPEPTPEGPEPIPASSPIVAFPYAHPEEYPTVDVSGHASILVESTDDQPFVIVNNDAAQLGRTSEVLVAVFRAVLLDAYHPDVVTAVNAALAKLNETQP